MTIKNFAIAILIFLYLIFYNQQLAQKSLQNTKSSPLSIELVSLPDTIKSKNPHDITWRVIAPEDMSTTFTTIYWSPSSSPSALTKVDSPDALKYPSFTADYTSGTFYLPYTFSSSLTFDKPTTIWVRAYANVRGNHLWSEEKKIVVTP